MLFDRSADSPQSPLSGPFKSLAYRSVSQRIPNPNSLIPSLFRGIYWKGVREAENNLVRVEMGVWIRKLKLNTMQGSTPSLANWLSFLLPIIPWHHCNVTHPHLFVHFNFRPTLLRRSNCICNVRLLNFESIHIRIAGALLHITAMVVVEQDQWVCA